MSHWQLFQSGNREPLGNKAGINNRKISSAKRAQPLGKREKKKTLQLVNRLSISASRWQRHWTVTVYHNDNRKNIKNLPATRVHEWQKWSFPVVGRNDSWIYCRRLLNSRRPSAWYCQDTAPRYGMSTPLLKTPVLTLLHSFNCSGPVFFLEDWQLAPHHPWNFTQWRWNTGILSRAHTQPCRKLRELGTIFPMVRRD